MIDVDKIRRQPTAWSIFTELLANALSLALFAYGVACLVLLRGLIPVGARGNVYSTLHLKPVTGAAAALAGLACLGFGFFVYLSDGSPPEENRTILWRILRAIIRWGGLVTGITSGYSASVAGGYQGPLNLEAPALPLLVMTLGFIVALAILIGFLNAMFQREAVKRVLNANGFEPVHISWRPAAYWLPWGYRWATGFRVIYTDPAGSVHKGYCIVYQSLWKEPQWGTREVRWLADTVGSGLTTPRRRDFSYWGRRPG